MRRSIYKPLLVLLFASMCASLSAQESGVARRPVQSYRKDNFAVKTNVAADAVAVANLGAEVAWNRCWSIDMPVYFSPWSFTGQDKLRILAVQPELRHWFGHTPMQGHFAGVHAHVGYFNVATGGDKRYQDNAPLVGGGISYGYALPLGKHWGAEFTLGAGYARISYDTYANYPNGPYLSSGLYNYWGVTRLGISLSYRFNL